MSKTRSRKRPRTEEQEIQESLNWVLLLAVIVGILLCAHAFV